MAVAHRGDKDTGSRSSGKYSLALAIPESVISPTKELGRLQCWVASGQTTNREGTQPHPSADKQIKPLLSSAQQSNTQLYPSPVPPIRQLAQASKIASSTRGQKQKQEELQFCSLWKENYIHRKTDKMKRQRTLYHMKEQDKTAEKQLNEVEIGNLPEKEFRIMIVKMIQDLGKKNGGKDREDARNV